MMDSDDLLAAFGRLVVRLRRIADARLAQEGVSLARMKLLTYLRCDLGGARAADLAGFLGQSPRTVSEAIEGLERDGLVRRTPDPQDGRAKRIALTAEGEAVLAAGEPLRRQLNQAIFGVLDAEEQRVLRATLAKLAEAAAEQEQQGGLSAWRDASDVPPR